MSKEPEDPTVNADQEKRLADIESGPSVQPEKKTGDSSSRPWPQNGKKDKRKKIAVSIVSVLSVIFLGLASWVAYGLWYQNPDKIVMDALVNAMTAKTVRFTGMSTSNLEHAALKVDFSGQFGHKEGGIGSVQFVYEPEDGEKILYKISGAMGTDDYNYIKFHNIHDVFGLVMDSMKSPDTNELSGQDQIKVDTVIDMLLKPIIEKIDGKWVKFTAKDIEKINATQAESFECTRKIVTKIGEQPAIFADFGQVYSKNRFLEIKKSLGKEGKDVGFVLGVKADALRQFAQSLKQTTIYKEFQKCSPRTGNPLDFQVPQGEIKDTVEIWVNEMSHQLTKLRFENTQVSDGQRVENAVEIRTTFNSAIDVVIPNTDIVQFDDAFSGVNAFVGKSFAEQWGQ